MTKCRVRVHDSCLYGYDSSFTVSVYTRVRSELELQEKRTPYLKYKCAVFSQNSAIYSDLGQGQTTAAK